MSDAFTDIIRENKAYHEFLEYGDCGGYIP